MLLPSPPLSLLFFVRLSSTKRFHSFPNMWAWFWGITASNRDDNAEKKIQVHWQRLSKSNHLNERIHIYRQHLIGETHRLDSFSLLSLSFPIGRTNSKPWARPSQILPKTINVKRNGIVKYGLFLSMRICFHSLCSEWVCVVMCQLPFSHSYADWNHIFPLATFVRLSSIIR